MKTKLHIPAFLLISCASILATPVELPKYGFKIDPLDADPGSTPVQVLTTFLPPNGGFAPNVNVVIQPYAQSMADYIKLSKGQFAQMGWTVESEKSISENEWTAEYSGTMNGVELHWYSRAVLSDGKVYLVTATSGASSWETFRESLVHCVNSFALEKP